ncbi:EF-hand domain-containing protein [Derxia gummosa]|uniref:EF-hand domain-containing protein n=1 Tax=Derxia gummosa DSM 723 TaxID=1121388 RepID=A0A8B6X3A5_9BURK|nr:EF-hand domain-containing protein [Derxia gummosa]
MSTIGSIGGSTMQGWGRTGGAERGGGARMQQEMFNKLDGDGDGAISKTEMQSALDSLTSASGSTSSTSVDDIFKRADSDGDGSLSSDELSSDMDSQRQQAMSSVNFAQMHNAMSGMGGMGGAGGPPPGPPPSGGPGGGQGGLSGLDSDDDGSVSKSEFGLDDGSGTSTASSQLTKLFDTIDGDGDGSLSSDEIGSFEDTMKSLFDQAGGASSSSSSSTSDGSASSASTGDSARLAQMVNGMLSHYLGIASDDWGGSSGKTVSVAA